MFLFVFPLEFKLHSWEFLSYIWASRTGINAYSCCSINVFKWMSEWWVLIHLRTLSKALLKITFFVFLEFPLLQNEISVCQQHTIWLFCRKGHEWTDGRVIWNWVVIFEWELWTLKVDSPASSILWSQGLSRTVVWPSLLLAVHPGENIVTGEFW